MMEMKLYFTKLVDSRDKRGLKHELGNIIVMSIYAVLCGYTDAENMAFFMKLQEAYFTERLDLKHGVPSADTLLRVFAIIEPESFMQMFYCWIKDGLTVIQKNSISEVQRIAIDGKAVRAAAIKGGNIPYIISAYLENYGLSIGQLKVGEKTNEIKEIPKLLKKLDITDSVITIDAIGCQKEIAKQIVEQKGHYCLAVKTNQTILYREVKEYFDYAEKEEKELLDTYQTIENNLHWVLDVHFREDACKVKLEKAMQNLTLVRKICYNLMKLDKRFDKKKKMTYKKMSMMYTCNLEYIEELLFQRIKL